MCANNGDIREVSRGSKSIFMKLIDERDGIRCFASVESDVHVLD